MSPISLPVRFVALLVGLGVLAAATLPTIAAPNHIVPGQVITPQAPEPDIVPAPAAPGLVTAALVAAPLARANINLLGNITAIAAGGGHTCALTTGGGVQCWGANMVGTLGDGTTTDRLTPVDVVDPDLLDEEFYFPLIRARVDY